MRDWEGVEALKTFIEQGVARIKASAQERFKRAKEIIKKARGEVQYMMKECFIIDPDKE